VSEEDLRRRALELREKGYSYRKISEELNLGNVAIAYYLVNPKSSLKQKVEELINRVSALEESLEKNEARINENRAGIGRLEKSIKDLKATLTAFDKRLRNIENAIASLNSQLPSLRDDTSKLRSDLQSMKEEGQRIKGLLEEIRKSQSSSEAELEVIKDSLNSLGEFQFWTMKSALKRIHDEEYACRYIDKDGCCTLWEWPQIPKHTRPESRHGKTVYRLNVREIPYVCAACPAYKSKKQK